MQEMGCLPQAPLLREGAYNANLPKLGPGQTRGFPPRAVFTVSEDDPRPVSRRRPWGRER